MIGPKDGTPKVPSERVDERDTMFARAARVPGTPAFEDYYARRPDLRAVDDRLRRMPGLLQPGGRHFHPELSPAADRLFDAIPGTTTDPAAVERWSARLAQAADPGALVKAMVRELGAVAVGFTDLDPAFVYSVKGRHDRDYGRAVELDHRRAVVFLVEMDFDAMQRSPMVEAIVESARQYRRAAEIAKTAAAVLEVCGHRAKAHFDASYDVILPPLAVQAGLGELGRNNILIAERYGSRVRIGAVTTDLPLAGDAPISLGADHFCELCRKCADNCPSGALSSGGKECVRGVSKWPTHIERCYAYWRVTGTDCGVCMAVCPFSHRDNWFHNLVRAAIRRFEWCHRFALRCDDLFYGRRWRNLPGGREDVLGDRKFGARADGPRE
jgi:ferredoxin